MKIAVLTCLRDRLAYTQHCYPTLLENAGCDFDWFVVDQNSNDGTSDWLKEQNTAEVCWPTANLGICRALNLLLDGGYCNAENYDVIVRWDNDCEVLTPGTLKSVAAAADAYGWILAPEVLGLRMPPPQQPPAPLGPFTVGETTTLGGIFMAIPSDLFTDWGYRYDDRHPPYTGDEQICSWWRANGGRCGYVHGLQVNHYERVDEQAVRFPAYQARKQREMAS